MSLANYMERSLRRCTHCGYCVNEEYGPFWCKRNAFHITSDDQGSTCKKFTPKGEEEPQEYEKEVGKNCTQCVQFGPSPMKKGFCKIMLKMPGQKLTPVCNSFKEIKE